MRREVAKGSLKLRIQERPQVGSWPQSPSLTSKQSLLTTRYSVGCNVLPQGELMCFQVRRHTSGACMNRDSIYSSNGDISRGTGLQRWEPRIHGLKTLALPGWKLQDFPINILIAQANCGGLDWLKKFTTEDGGFLMFLNIVRNLHYFITHIHIKKSNKSLHN